MFRCRRCKILKEIGEFSPNVTRGIGHEYYCRKCKNDFAREKKYYLRQKPRSKEWWKNYYQKNRKKRIQGVIESNKRHPDRVKARNKAKYFRRSGKLNRQSCFICKNLKSEAHHYDYNKPLEVIWVCRRHHEMLHITS